MSTCGCPGIWFSCKDKRADEIAGIVPRVGGVGPEDGPALGRCARARRVAGKDEILKSRPGRVMKEAYTIRGNIHPVFHCMQDRDPCTTVCQFDSIKLKGETGTIMDLRSLTAVYCLRLVRAICPGLAVQQRLSPTGSRGGTAHEFSTAYEAGSQIPICDLDGNVLGQGTVLKQRYFRKYGTHLITVEVPEEWAHLAAGIRVQPEGDVQPLSEAEFQYFPEDGIVCRCERSPSRNPRLRRENPIHDLQSAEGHQGQYGSMRR